MCMCACMKCVSTKPSVCRDYSRNKRADVIRPQTAVASAVSDFVFLNVTQSQWRGGGTSFECPLSTVLTCRSLSLIPACQQEASLKLCLHRKSSFSFLKKTFGPINFHFADRHASISSSDSKYSYTFFL